MNRTSLLSLLLTLTACDAVSNYFLLESPNGCIGQQDGSDELLLKECNPEDEQVLWRRDIRYLNRFRSYADDSECIQVGSEASVLSGIDSLKRGSRVYKQPCASVDDDTRAPFQAFDLNWNEGALTLIGRPDLCVVHFGARPTVGESRIMMVPCNELGGDRKLGWSPTRVEFKHIVLDSMPGFERGGCIGRKRDGSDELLYKTCRSDDDYVQWRLDNQGRMRSKVNDTECMQADQRPHIEQEVEVMGRGTTMYVKPCAIPGSLKEGFQVFNETWIGNGGQGPLSLASRSDLCVVHFGAEPVVGESRIMLVECASLGDARAKGWEATDPCATPPVCSARNFNETTSATDAIVAIEMDRLFDDLDATASIPITISGPQLFWP